MYPASNSLGGSTASAAAGGSSSFGGSYAGLLNGQTFQGVQGTGDIVSGDANSNDYQQVAITTGNYFGVAPAATTGATDVLGGSANSTDWGSAIGGGVGYYFGGPAGSQIGAAVGGPLFKGIADGWGSLTGK